MPLEKPAELTATAFLGPRLECAQCRRHPFDRCTQADCGAFDTRFRALDESDLPAGLDRFQQQAVDILRSDRVRAAFDVDRESAAVRDSYGPSALGRCALTARRLVEAGARRVLAWWTPGRAECLSPVTHTLRSSPGVHR